MKNAMLKKEKSSCKLRKSDAATERMGPEPPLFADLLSYFLLAGLIYLFVYSLRLREHLKRKAQLPEPVEPVEPTQPQPPILQIRPNEFEFFIEPSPIPGQKIPFPTIAESEADLDLSIVIPVRNPGPGILAVLQCFVNFLAQRKNFRYEIVVVDLFSRDTTRADCVAFAETHKEVRVLHVPFRCLMNVGIVIGILRTRGKLVYLFNVSDGVRIEMLEQYEEKMNRGLQKSNKVVVCGLWTEEEKCGDDELMRRSTLNYCMEWLERWLMSWIVDDDLCEHARTFLMTREAVDLIGSTLQIPAESYDMELLVIAAVTNMCIKGTRLSLEDPRKDAIESMDRVDNVVSILVAVFMYYTGSWRIYRSE